MHILNRKTLFALVGVCLAVSKKEAEFDLKGLGHDRAQGRCFNKTHSSDGFDRAVITTNILHAVGVNAVSLALEQSRDNHNLPCINRAAATYRAFG